MPDVATSTRRVGIIGAGTMGAGIAQVAVMHGWTVELQDIDPATTLCSIESVRKRLDRLVEKGRLSQIDRDAAAAKLLCATEPQCLTGCEFIIEAVLEQLDLKIKVLRPLVEEALGPDTIIATNTSSLSVTAIGRALGIGRRIVGMHFFNPAPLMPLVEIIQGDETDERCTDRIAAIAADEWGKKVARARDTPGFIVNQVARPYYLEAFRILEDGYAGPAEIDAAMKKLGGFRMGPLELTDLIGQDINSATTRSVWERLNEPPMLTPVRTQQQLVNAGHLGRKTGRGVYDYSVDAPRPAIELKHRALEMSAQLRDAVSSFVRAATEQTGDSLQEYIFARILVAVIIQAALAHARGVAGTADIDMAMKYGANYPQGPFQWAQRIGLERIAALLVALDQAENDHRFALPQSLHALL